MNKLITVISGTNRPNSHTAVVARFLFDYLKQENLNCRFVDLAELSPAILSPEMYDEDEMLKELVEIQDHSIVRADKFIFVAPEYNGSIPGVLKVFLDALSIRSYNESFFHKKACLVGVASGRAGNLRGLDHLSDILTYLGVIIFPSKLPVSRIFEFMESGQIKDQQVLDALKKLVDDFLDF